MYLVNEIIPWIVVALTLAIVIEAMLRRDWAAITGNKVRPDPELYVHPTRLSACETVAAISVHLRQMEEYELPNLSGRSGASETLCRQPVGWDNKFGIGEVTCSVCIKEALARYPEELMLGNDI